MRGNVGARKSRETRELEGRRLLGRASETLRRKKRERKGLLAGSCSSPALSEGFGLSAFLHPPLLSSSLLGSSAGKGQSARFLIFFSAWP